MKTIAFLSLAFLAPLAHAEDMNSICRRMAVNFVSEKFESSYSSPKVWVDQADEVEGSQYPTYLFQVRLSGEFQGTWAHQVWKVKATSMRGGCGVVSADLLNESRDN